MKRILLALATGLVAGALAWAAWRLLAGSPSRPLPPPPNASAAAIAALDTIVLPDSAGKPHALSQWRGQVRVINWWATWCGPCKEEMPMFSQLQERYGKRGVQFVGIAADEMEKVRQHASQHPVAYPLLVGSADAIQSTRELGNLPLAVPFTLVLDRDGKPRTAVLGRVDERELEKLLEGLL